MTGKITAAGWHSQFGDDRLAVLGPAPVGMGLNNIPHHRKKVGDRRFSQIQQEFDEAQAHRRAHRRSRNSAAD